MHVAVEGTEPVLSHDKPPNSCLVRGMTFDSEPKRSQFVDRNSTLSPVIPAPSAYSLRPESRRFLKTKTNLDGGVRRYDELSLRLKARKFNNPGKGHQIPRITPPSTVTQLPAYN